MSYQVLARKWRPKTFAELVGQEHVVTALTNALNHGRLHHAYLLTGTRGVGKTTIARILAKSLNCLTHGVSATPCGTCEACLEIDAGRFVELLARAAQGSMRDALSLLDQAIAYGGGKVEAGVVRQMLGSVEREYLWRLLDALAQRDGKALLAEAAGMAERNLSFDAALQELG